MSTTSKLMDLTVSILRFGSPALDARIVRYSKRSGLPSVAMVADITPFSQAFFYRDGGKWAAAFVGVDDEGVVQSFMPTPSELNTTDAGMNPRWVYGLLLSMASGLLRSIENSGVTSGPDHDLLTSLCQEFTIRLEQVSEAF